VDLEVLVVLAVAVTVELRVVWFSVIAELQIQVEVVVEDYPHLHQQEAEVQV
jgi:hypothetical protein